MNGATPQETVLGGQSLRRTRSGDSFRVAFADLRFTILTVGPLLVVAGVTVGVALIVGSSGSAGDVTAKTTEFRISMLRSLRAGHHTFAYTNRGSIPHELLARRGAVANGECDADCR
jgi:hypothetical protein